MQYYNRYIQLDIKVVVALLDDIKHFQMSPHPNPNPNPNPKMLVFGLGHDSLMWHKATHGNTYFIEDNQEYIDLVKNTIPSDRIFKYNYLECGFNTNLCLKMTSKYVEKHAPSPPAEILRKAPYDIILIDGPAGFKPSSPGRLLPFYWSSVLLSGNNTIIYADDANRPLERHCINVYFNNYPKSYFAERQSCVRIVFQ